MLFANVVFVQLALIVCVVECSMPYIPNIGNSPVWNLNWIFGAVGTLAPSGGVSAKYRRAAREGWP